MTASILRPESGPARPTVQRVPPGLARGMFIAYMNIVAQVTGA